MSARTVIDRHRDAGRFYEVDGLRSFVRDEGDGEPVICIHGVPTSSFLYRKFIESLADRGFRGISFDFPGMGLADRPQDYDYTWTGLGKFCVKSVDALKLDKFHLVVHDIGGPIGFELAAERPQSIRSLTILNTMLRVSEFNRPWVMEPFAYALLDRLWLASMVEPVFRPLFYYFGVESRDAIESEEIQAYVKLLKRDDEGRAFLKIMKGFERTSEKQNRYITALNEADFPIQAIWGKQDPALPPSPYLDHVSSDVGLVNEDLVKARHFLPEEKPNRLADRIAELTS